MKRVLEYIEHKCEAFDQRPLFKYLADPSVDPWERLRFAPTMAHFVLTFADMYHFFLRDPGTTDRYQQIINAHLDEEDAHWKWFLADLDTLGLNRTMEFTDALRVIWAKETRQTRVLAYSICQLSYGLTSLEKLVMVLAIEGTGRSGIGALVPAGSLIEQQVGKPLVFFGGHHLESEQNHTVEDEQVRESLGANALSDAELERMQWIVDEVFMRFTAFADECFEHASNEQRLARLTGSVPIEPSSPQPNLSA